MNKAADNTSSTTGSLCNSREYNKVTNEKMVALLKLVYFERKSIKQSSKYLNINYNAAKRIILNFRKNKLNLENKSNIELEDLVIRLKMQKENQKNNFEAFNENKNYAKNNKICYDENEKETSEMIINNNKNQSTNINNNTGLLTQLVVNQIKQLDSHLKSLNEEVKVNQNTLIYLMSWYKFMLNQSS